METSSLVLFEFNAFQKKNLRIYNHWVKGHGDDLETMMLKFNFLKKVEKLLPVGIKKYIFA